MTYSARHREEKSFGFRRRSAIAGACAAIYLPCSLRAGPPASAVPFRSLADWTDLAGSERKLTDTLSSRFPEGSPISEVQAYLESSGTRCSKALHIKDAIYCYIEHRSFVWLPIPFPIIYKWSIFVRYDPETSRVASYETRLGTTGL